MTEQLRSELLQLLGSSPIAGQWLTNEGAAEFTSYSVDYLTRNEDFIRGVHFTGDGRNRRWNKRWLDWWMLDRDNLQRHLQRIAIWELQNNSGISERDTRPT